MYKHYTLVGYTYVVITHNIHIRMIIYITMENEKRSYR